jgi:two-component sensor histidine kinase
VKTKPAPLGTAPDNREYTGFSPNRRYPLIISSLIPGTPSWLHPVCRCAKRVFAHQDQQSIELAETRRDLELETAVSHALSRLYEPLISPDSTIRQMAELVLDQARELTGSPLGFVATLAYDGSQEVVSKLAETHSCQPPAGHGVGLNLPRGTDGKFAGLRGLAFNTGEAHFTNSPREHPAFAGYPKWHFPVDRFLSVPVILEGKPAAQIALANPPCDYGPKDLHAVQRLAGFYALALQRKHGEDRMKAALEEKEVLLREIHHRVKNNLQIISSLLNLQAGSLRDPAVLEMLKESQNRVRSMAMVHEQLHRSRNLSRIDLREYVRNLVAGLFSSYGVSSSQIALLVEVADVCLPIDLAVSCGLVVQELVSNALKHAFPDGRQGQITVSLIVRTAEAGEQSYELTVRDNGVGLPDGISPETGRSLGLRLVRILAEQLNATLHCGDGSGAEFRIEFPASI